MRIETTTRSRVVSYEDTTLILTPEETDAFDALLKVVGARPPEAVRIEITNDQGCRAYATLSRAKRST